MGGRPGPAGAVLRLLSYSFPALFIKAPGGFDSLESLAALLNHDERLLLAAWLHYLAFDMLIGKMILEDSQARGVPHGWMLAPLLLCFVMGPIGWLLYRALRPFTARKMERPT